jgi:hypothetical protein
MGDWVAHPSNTAANRILVTYPLLTAVSGQSSPEPLGIRMNKPIESLLQLLSHLGSYKPKLGLQNPTEFIVCPMIIALWSHCKPGISSLSHQQKWSLFNDHVQQDRRPVSKIDDL